MNAENFKSFAEQLRKPVGSTGKEVGEKMNQGNRLMNLETVSRLELQANDSVLEIGMGNGFFVRDILSMGEMIKYSGCDFSETMVNESIALNKEFIEKGAAQFVQANADCLPYDDEQFDKVFTVNTIYFWEDIQLVLSEIKRVLKNNGVLILSLRPKSIMDNLPITKYGFLTFSPSDIVELLASCGFKIDSITEKEEAEFIFFDEKFKNAFFIVKALTQK